MVIHKENRKPPTEGVFYLRKLTKSGGSRYLSVGKILPETWENVKVTPYYKSEGIIFLEIKLIK